MGPSVREENGMKLKWPFGKDARSGAVEVENAAVARGHENVARGTWGEACAERYLTSRGLHTLARNVRPCSRDRRCEIDLVMRSADGSGIVFVEVKTHRTHGRSRLAGIDRRKKGVLLRACANWIVRNRWHGDFRLDVVEVYGEIGGVPEIDHMRNVPLFPPKWRFW